MSTRRLAVTALALTVIGLVLAQLGPAATTIQEALTQPQWIADATGPDAVVLAWAAALAWAVWGWGVLGLGLTAATAVPGLLGIVARLLLRGALPAGARRAAAVALGIGLGVGVGSPGLAGAAPASAVPVSAPDWPAAGRLHPPAPDWPAVVPAQPAPDGPAGTSDQYVVVRGDCLWEIAAA